MDDEREFDSEAERQAYLAGVEDTAKKMQKPPLTVADVRNMSVQEVEENLPAVRAALRRGDDKGGDDGGDGDGK